MLTDAISECQGICVVTPTHYGLPPSGVLSLIARAMRSRGDAFFGKPMLPIATARRAGAISTINAVNTLFTFAGTPIVTAKYPTVIYGGTAEKICTDTEGLGNIRAGIEALISLVRANG